MCIFVLLLQIATVLPILSTEKTSSIVCLSNEGKDFGIFPLSLIDITPLFEKSIDESVAIKTSPVAQNRYFLDLVNKKSLMFSDIVDGDYKIPIEILNIR
jgi:hypothetical protein